MARFTKESLQYCDNYLQSTKNNANIDFSRRLVDGFTIDDESTKDMDDAVYVEKTDAGWEVTVSITDVAEAIEKNSPLFENAIQNKATRYLGTHNVEMLPPELSLNKLSIMPNQHRNTISFKIFFDEQLNVIDFQVFESYIESTAKLSYKEVAHIVNKKKSEHPQYEILCNASKLTKQLYNKRRLAGALAFYDIVLGMATNEEGQLIRIPEKEKTLAYLIIQELMILTNSETSKYFAMADLPFIYRNHSLRASAPGRDDIMEEVSLASLNPTSIHALSEKMKLWYKRAVYQTYTTGHYGLSLPAYTHVTSPIRRLTDLLNQYIIKAYLRNEPQPFTLEQLNEYCSEINEYVKAEKDATAIFHTNKENKLRLKALVQSTQEDLWAMNEKEFRRILKAARESSTIGEKLIVTLSSKIDNKDIKAIDIYELLYRSLWIHTQDQLMQKCFDNLNQDMGAYISLFAFLERDGLIKHSYEEIKENANIYYARYIIETVDGERKTSPNISENISKKTAIQEAAKNTILCQYNNTLICLSDAEPLISPSVKVQIANYISLLHEMEAIDSNFKILAFDFTDNKVDQSPNRFTSTLELKVNNKLMSFTADGSNKKEAKAQVAKAAYIAISKTK